MLVVEPNCRMCGNHLIIKILLLYDLLCFQVVEELTKASGVTKILVADSDAFVGFLPERLAPLVLASQSQFNYTHIVGTFQWKNKMSYFPIE